MRNSTKRQRFDLDVVNVSAHGFSARVQADIPAHTRGRANIELGPQLHSSVTASTVRQSEVNGQHVISFRLHQTDPAWVAFIADLDAGTAHVAL